MKILQSAKFTTQIDEIIWYIAQDKRSAALRFAKELKKTITELKNFPYKYRASYYYDDEHVRDMIFKGYTIIYRISTDTIEILEIFNQNQPPK